MIVSAGNMTVFRTDMIKFARDMIVFAGNMIVLRADMIVFARDMIVKIGEMVVAIRSPSVPEGQPHSPHQVRAIQARTAPGCDRTHRGSAALEGWEGHGEQPSWGVRPLSTRSPP